MKKLTALILGIGMIFVFTACQKSNSPSLNNPSESINDVTITNSNDNLTIKSDETENIADLIVTDVNGAENQNPENWNVEQIVEFYKSAAALTHPKIKSQHKIELKSISVNNGQYENVFNFITPIMAKLLANNSTDKDGITGGHYNLTADDVASAKAYKSGNNVIIEITMKEQISSGNEDALSGSVGHAITAVGDIGVVTKQLKDLGLPLEFSEKDTRIVYTNPTVKVVINENGIIINGTWKYTVSINLNNYKAFGKHVDSTSVVMDNILSVNGGFKK